MEAAVDHIVLATPDVDRSAAFYSDVPEPEFISPGGILGHLPAGGRFGPGPVR